MRAYCLTIHAAYQCAHSGACCTAGWPIPIDPERVSALRARGMIPDGGDARPLVLRRAGSATSRTMMIGTAAGGACVFYDADHGRLCAIHRDAGPELMPSACRNFPRIALRDGRGLFVTLSHFCPTAARLLLAAGDIGIVEAPPGLSLMGEVEGLDATLVMPPLLRPGMLMDLDGYSAWEHEAIAVLDERTYAARTAVAVIAAGTEGACTWRPGANTLVAHVAHAFARARAIHQSDGVRHSRVERATKAFLAAHLFANWAAYQNGGLRAVVTALESALALLGTHGEDGESFVAAVRAADLRLRHSGPRLCE
ncbi:MAG: YkgJ family cysteine cluster protein [Vicinamibacterales bacterium]